MRQPQVWTVLHEQLCNARVVCEDFRRPGFDLSEHLRMKVFDGIGHGAMFSYLRTTINLFVRPMLALSVIRMLLLSAPAVAQIKGPETTLHLSPTPLLARPGSLSLAPAAGNGARLVMNAGESPC